MKRLFIAAISLALLLSISGCGNEEDHAYAFEIVDWGESELYSDDDITSAIDTVAAYFETEFKGCSLTQIRYPGDDARYLGDDSSGLYDQWAENYETDEAIVLLSSFDTDSSGGDGSLYPNYTYQEWQWILTRNTGGVWEVATYGYG